MRSSSPQAQHCVIRKYSRNLHRLTCILYSASVDYCGYSIPHPSEAKMNVHIQTTDSTNAVEALNKGFDDLTDLCNHVISTFKKELKNGNFEYSPEGNWAQK